MNIKGWRTIAFNVVTLLLLVISQTEFTALLPESAAQYIGYIMVAGNFILRFLTDTPIGSKTQKAN